MDSKEDCFSESHFAETRKSLQEASNLPGFVYSSPEWFEAEMRGIFLREWNCIGRVEQVKNPGDYFTVDIGGELVSVIRNEKNELRAVLPVCRHRAATLLKGAGSCRAIVCPYHGWTYDLSGRLVARPGAIVRWKQSNSRPKSMGSSTFGSTKAALVVGNRWISADVVGGKSCCREAFAQMMNLCGHSR
jgi:phenylpropionate dioxygenase-like ring-hydroxylating dioxygenase large terminal subunit